MCEFSLENMLRKENLEPRGFFKAVAPYSTPHDAVKSISDGDADCLLIDVGTWGNLQGSQPGLAKQVVILRRSPTVLPPKVLVGRRVNLEILRRGLWEDLQRQLETIAQTAEGKQCVRFLWIDGFKRCDKGFEDLVDRTARDLLEWGDRFYVGPK